MRKNQFLSRVYNHKNYNSQIIYYFSGDKTENVCYNNFYYIL